MIFQKQNSLLIGRKTQIAWILTALGEENKRRDMSDKKIDAYHDIYRKSVWERSKGMENPPQINNLLLNYIVTF